MPLIGAEGWEGDPPSSAAGDPGAADSGTAALTTPAPTTPARRAPAADLPSAIASPAEPFGAIEDADLGPLLARIGDARVVLLGEATHGTSEFYRFRARLTRELVARHGFQIVAVEADWPPAVAVPACLVARGPYPHGR